jgi:GNAT superfamily N-acetyltransferase
MDDFEIRRLEPREWADLFPIIAQLRPHLTEEEFLRQVRRQSHGGYELVGALRAGRIVGILGMRPVHTLARGTHLHIDDIIVDEAERRTGGGRALMVTPRQTRGLAAWRRYF